MLVSPLTALAQNGLTIAAGLLLDTFSVRTLPVPFRQPARPGSLVHPCLVGDRRVADAPEVPPDHCPAPLTLRRPL